MTYVNVLEALSDPTRRTLVEHLQKGASSVNELSTIVPVSQPAVSQHLRVLKHAGLVHVRQDGARRLYTLAPEGLAELRRYVDRLWEDVLTAFQEAAGKQEKEKNNKENANE